MLAAARDGRRDDEWFAVHVKSQCEARVDRELQMRGFESLLPLCAVRRRRSDRVKESRLPLFPGYVFCRFDLQHRIRILNVPGVARIVGFGPTPAPVSAGEIESIRALVQGRVPISPWPYLSSGQQVRFDNGPLAGLAGVVVSAEDGKPRVVVSVTMLQRSVAAVVEREWIGSVS